MDYFQKNSLFLLQLWLNSPFLSPVVKTNLLLLTAGDKEKCFQYPYFGCGFRGFIGLGSCCFNQLTTKVIALSLLQFWKKKQKVLIFHDHRHQSKLTSEYLANIFQKFGLQVYLFANNQAVPTPFLSFVLNHSQRFQAGIMITASHNGKNFNGFKLFHGSGFPWNSNDNIAINKIIFRKYQEFFEKQLILKPQKPKEISLLWKTRYLQKVLTVIQNKSKLTFKDRKQIKILYSPLHGMGLNWTDQLLQKAGFQVTLVSQQAKIDPDFSTVSEPNPEQDATFDLAKKQIGKGYPPHLIVLNDGDADRMRAACWHENKIYYLSGNQIALIFVCFLLEEKKAKGKIYSSHVSSLLIDRIVYKSKNCSMVKAGTGFGNLADKYQKQDKSKFVLAFEESLGFLLDLKINCDKDGLQAALFLAEITAFCWQKKISLWQYLQNIYQKYGFFYEWKKSYLLAKNNILDCFNFLQVGDLFASRFVLTKKRSLFLKNPVISSLFLFFFKFKARQGKKCLVAIRHSQTEPVQKLYFFGYDQVISKNFKNILDNISLK